MTFKVETQTIFAHSPLLMEFANGVLLGHWWFLGKIWLYLKSSIVVFLLLLSSIFPTNQLLKMDICFSSTSMNLLKKSMRSFHHMDLLSKFIEVLGKANLT